VGVAFPSDKRYIASTTAGRTDMPSKPNYNFQRAERDRAKKASKELKLQEKKKAAESRKTDTAEPSDAPEPNTAE
jgi:hypothetical protein